MNEWIEWGGGECPVGDDCFVEIIMSKYRKDERNIDKAGDLYWQHMGQPCDIIKYRIVETKEDKGLKFDNGKLDWSLLDLSILNSVIRVLQFGAKKYDRDNWKKVDDAKNRYFSALIRHLSAWQSGEKNDNESGLSHLSHACCCLIFLMWFEDNGNNTD